MFHGHQTVTDPIDRGSRLLEYDVADEWLVTTVVRPHVDEDDLVEDRVEPFDLDANRAADLAHDDALVGGFELDGSDGRQGAEPVPPRCRKDEPARARIDEGVAADLLRGI